MRTLRGQAILPDTVSEERATRVIIEVRDVSQADAASEVLAAMVLEDVPLQPSGTVEFEIDVPEAEPGRTLALRVHVDMDGSGAVTAGDLVTTQHLPISDVGNVDDLVAPLTRI